MGVSACRSGYNSTCSNTSYRASPVHKNIAVYGVITASTIVLNFARIIAIFWVTNRAACILHDQMLSSLLGAATLFFDTIPIGIRRVVYS